jgi:hypothetical protein
VISHPNILSVICLERLLLQEVTLYYFGSGTYSYSD